MMASSAATFFTMLDLRLRWDVHASSVRWLFWLFFLYVFIWCSARSVFFFWWSMYPDCIRERAPEDIAESPDRLDFRTLFEIRETSTLWMSIIICVGDVALMAIGLTVFPLTYELWNLARLSMDRGVEKEQKQIWKYSWIIHGLVVLFALTELAIALRAGRHTLNTHLCLLATYVVQMVGMIFMVGLLLRLRINGRKYETIHGTFIASPVYQRLKRIMLVYAIFSFQYQLSSLVMYLEDSPRGTVELTGLSMILYNATGLALAITTSCSQACVFSTCAPCLPEDFEVEFEHQRYCGADCEAPAEEDLEAPSTNPIFVFTDIQSSSALWALGDGHMMDAATELHDNILRSALPKHRGYEITTRVAAWLRHHKDDVSSHFVLDRLGVYGVPQVNMEVDVFQVMPSMLAARMPHFPVPGKTHPRVIEHPMRPTQKILVDQCAETNSYAMLAWRGKYLRALNICPEDAELLRKKMQHQHGHKARMRTWSYRSDVEPPSLSRSYSSSSMKSSSSNGQNRVVFAQPPASTPAPGSTQNPDNNSDDMDDDDLGFDLDGELDDDFEEDEEEEIFEMEEFDGSGSDPASPESAAPKSRRRFRTASLNVVQNGREKRSMHTHDRGLPQSFVPPHQLVQRDCFSIGLRDELKRRPANNI
ncbi:hypothetical protein ATCC90586_004700 [Pythium insidiosum]|nr:hypothetical protein ATCC90586_004700 [Pythium insidiosum]